MANEGRSGRERGIKILPLKSVEDIPVGRPADWLHANDSKCAFQGLLGPLNRGTPPNYTNNQGVWVIALKEHFCITIVYCSRSSNQ